MKISFSTPTYDLNGHVELDVSRYRLGELTRRASRTATLDGGVDHNDFGFAYGDGDLTVSFTPTQAQHEAMVYLISNYSLLTVCTWDGVYRGYLAYQMRDDGTADIQIFFTEKLGT